MKKEFSLLYEANGAHVKFVVTGISHEWAMALINLCVQKIFAQRYQRSVDKYRKNEWYGMAIG